MNPQRAVILVNPSSGAVARHDIDTLRTTIETAFAGHGIATTFEFPEGRQFGATVRRHLRSAPPGAAPAIVVVGGDGSVNAAAQALAESDAALGLVPLGTLNNFARDVGVPLTIEEAVATIAAGHVRTVDVGEINGRTFVNNSSIGLYPYLVLVRERRRRRSRLPKWLGTGLAAVRALRDLPIRRLSILADGDMRSHRSSIVFIGNNAYELAGRAVGRRAALDGGRLCLYLARHEGRLALVRLAWRALTARLDFSRDLVTLVSSDIRITSHRKRMLVAYDGEIRFFRLPLRYRSRPGALRVFAPPAPVSEPDRAKNRRVPAVSSR